MTTDDNPRYGKGFPRVYDEDVKRVMFEICKSYRGEDEHPPGICPTCASWLDTLQDLKEDKLMEDLDNDN